MKKVIILASIDLGSTVAKAIHDNIDQSVVINNIEAKNIVNEVFKPEPIPILCTHTRHTNTQIIVTPRNKFFDKPKNNFKK